MSGDCVADFLPKLLPDKGHGIYVTLTYAQSIDGSISTQPGVPTALSNPLSFQLTHELRAAHDSIMVGVNTVIADNPSLTCRFAKCLPIKHPTPVIVDSNLQIPLTSKLVERLTQHDQAEDTPKTLIIGYVETDRAGEELKTFLSRKQTLAEIPGVHLIRCKSTKTNRVDLGSLVGKFLHFERVRVFNLLC
jgi:riboflavin-specific deaminase-like protein